MHCIAQTTEKHSKHLKKRMGIDMMKTKKNTGFTLIELLVVVAIIGIIAAIAVPAYNGYITQGKITAAEAVLEQFPVLIETYRAENGFMCPENDPLTANKSTTYSYTESSSGAENTTGKKITDIFPDFKAKSSTTSEPSMYHYKIVFAVSNCAVSCEESATFTAEPQTSRGAPSGDITSNEYK